MEPSITPSAPLRNSSTAAATSSTSMRLWARQSERAETDRTGPMNHWSMSMAWIDWFMSAPPPSRSLVPRQAPES